MKPQSYLTKRGVTFFKQIVKHLDGKTVDTDSFIISQAAQCLDMMYGASEQINKSGYVQPTKNGYDVINGHFTAWKESNNRFEKYIRELGLSPAAREKIAAFNDSDQIKLPSFN